MPRISVIIPTCDRLELLPRAISSVLDQTYRDFELIVVDDGSADDTANYLATIPQLTTIHQPNRGVSAAHNAGIKASSGELIALLDSDDAWTTDKLKTQVADWDASPGAPLSHTDEVWIRGGKRVNPMKKHRKEGGDVFSRCLDLCCISPSSTLLQRRLYDDIGDFDENLPACEDYDYWLRVTSLHPVHYVPKALTIKYGGHDDQLSRRFDAMDRFRVEALLKLLKSGKLTRQRQRETAAVSVRKLEILSAGAKKRQKTEDAQAYLAAHETALGYL